MKNRIAMGVIVAALATPTSPLFADTLAVSSSPGPSAAPATGSQSPLGPIEAHTLPNGLRVILSPQRDTARVAINVVYHVGFRDQPPGYRGLPHLLEHAMFDGSRHVRSGQYFTYLEQAGATVVNGTTRIDRTSYFEVLPANQLPLALWLESDRMAFLLSSLDEHGLTNVRRTVLNEYLLRTSSVPAGLAPRFLYETLFPGTHPYHGILDDDGDLAAIGLGDLQWFFQNYYGPQNATLVIAGNIDPHEALDLVTQYFGSIPRGSSPPPRTAPALPRATAERRITLDVPFLRGPITVAWVTPPEYEPGDAALDVLASLLRETPTSGLRDRLITRGAIADSVIVHQSSYQYASVFEIEVIPRRGAYIATVLPIIDEAVQTLRVSPLDQSQIYIAASRLALARQLEWQDPLARAQRLEGYDTHDGDPDGLARDIARYTRLDRASLHETAQRWLATDQRVVETIYAAPRAPLAGRLASSGLQREGGAL